MDDASEDVSGPVAAAGMVRPYLEGYSRGDPAVLEAMRGHDWQAAALAERRRRHDSLMTVLDEQTLKALASGSLDFAAVAAQLAAEMR